MAFSRQTKAKGETKALGTSGGNRAGSDSNFSLSKSTNLP